MIYFESETDKVDKAHIFGAGGEGGGGVDPTFVPEFKTDKDTKSPYFGGGRGEYIRIERWIQLMENNLPGLIMSRLFCRYTCWSQCHTM